MAHEWHAGVLSASSWHGLESVETMKTAEAMIAAGERSGAWPTQVGQFSLVAQTGAGWLKIERDMAKAVIGKYADGSERPLGVVGDRYTHTTPEGWRDLVKAAVAAGARPDGAFALRGGSRVLATFEVGEANGIRTHLCLADAFDGSLKLTAGSSAIRVVCANTLSAAMGDFRAKGTQLRHTSSLPEKMEALGEAIAESIKSGCAVKEAYGKAREAQLSKADAEAVLAALFPAPKEEGAKRSRALNLREDAIRAAARAENEEGPTLATLWNAATWLVDRDEKGNARAARGGADRLDSLLFGQRAKRIEEIRNIVEVVLKDGTTALVEAPEASKMGVDDAQIGRSMLEDMLG